MKLSELVELRDNIKEALDTRDAVTALTELTSAVQILLARTNEIKYQVSLEQALGDIQDIVNSVTQLSNHVVDVQADIDVDINKLTQKFFVDNYETEFEYNDPENIRRHRRLYIPSHAKPLLMSRLGANLDWRFPTLEIGCRDGEFTEHLVAGDPLYITDTHQDFLDSTISKFTPEYQRRIRPYLVRNQDFSNLPTGQFGFVFSWNHFNYLSLDSIKNYLQQIFDLLRPGGRVLFSYNNGDIPGAAEHAERYYMTYMPKSLLVPLCEMIGFTVHDLQDFEPAVSWAELQKPGELRTVKAHQVMGRILIDKK